MGRLWVGTLGGGIRVVEFGKERLHLTRMNGLPSNLILSLALGPDGTIWAATDKGLSRIREARGDLEITNYGALDGLGLPVRDVAVSGDGAAWLATDGGLFRILP